jgi:hypothetical protein
MDRLNRREMLRMAVALAGAGTIGSSRIDAAGEAQQSADRNAAD